MTKGKVRVGIDPDMIKSGIAVVSDDSEKRIIELASKGINDIVSYLASWHQNNDVTIFIEDPNMISPTFPRAINKAVSLAKVHDKISQDVGKVKATATLLIEILEFNGFKVSRVRPIKGQVKKLCKKNAEHFNQIFKYTGKSNEDNRDAAIIAVYGLPVGGFR